MSNSITVMLNGEKVSTVSHTTNFVDVLNELRNLPEPTGT